MLVRPGRRTPIEDLAQDVLEAGGDGRRWARPAAGDALGPGGAHGRLGVGPKPIRGTLSHPVSYPAGRKARPRPRWHRPLRDHPEGGQAGNTAGPRDRGAGLRWRLPRIHHRGHEGPASRDPPDERAAGTRLGAPARRQDPARERRLPHRPDLIDDALSVTLDYTYVGCLPVPSARARSSSNWAYSSGGPLPNRTVCSKTTFVVTEE